MCSKSKEILLSKERVELQAQQTMEDIHNDTQKPK